MTWNTLRETAQLHFNEIELIGRIEYDPGQHALAIIDPTTGEEEVLTVDLLSSGYVAFPGEVFVKEWSGHTGLAQALVHNRIAEIVEPVRVGPHAQTAYRLRIREHPLAFPTEERHSRSAELLPETEERIEAAHRAARAAAHGDSNDAEIEHLWELVETLMDALQIEGEIRP